MIAFRRHSARDYARLPDIDRTAVGDLTERDTACLAEVGDYLVRSGAYKRFGISLLHSHFPVFDGEVLVESVDRGRRAVFLRPVPAPDLTGDDLHMLSGCFEPGGEEGRIRVVGLEYGRRGQCGDTAAVSDLDSTALLSLRRILARHDALGRFGVRLIHDHLRLTKGEVLLESCDRNARVLECEVTTDDDPRFVSSIETFWAWEPRSPGEDGSAAQACMRKCLAGCIGGGFMGDGHHRGPHDVLHDREP